MANLDWNVLSLLNIDVFKMDGSDYTRIEIFFDKRFKDQ